MGALPAQAAPAKKATGDPIKVGFISLENSPVASFPESREAAQAAVKYVNTELGGGDGHPIELVICKASGTPEGSSKCANQFVEEGVVSVTGGADLNTDVSLPILAAAGIPLTGAAAVGFTEFTDPNSYLFSGASLSQWAALDRYVARSLEAKKVSLVHADIPQGELAATTFGKALLAKEGITDVKLVPEDQNAPDFTSAVNIAVEDSPDVVMVMMAGSACGGVMQAKQSLGIDIPFVYSSSCAAADILKQYGSAAQGDYFASDFTFYGDLKDPDVKIYRAKLKKYAPKKHALSSLSQFGFSNVMNLKAQFDEIGFDNLTSESLKAALDATKDQANFMAHPYTCDRKQVNLATAVCDTYAIVYQYKKTKMVDVSDGWVSGADLV
jgi:branched-chain amino acid transport system substrate-binding protein